MANMRRNRILGASHSNTHQSGNQSMNHGRQVSASFRPGGQHVVGEGTSGPSLEERIRKMEESQNEILQLLRETRQPALAPQEEVLLPQDPLGMDDKKQWNASTRRRKKRKGKRRRREEEKGGKKKLLLDHRRSSAGPPPDAGVPPDRRLTPEFRRTTT
ncbi:hypothetical protein M5K25_001429 [Dendrobium thyrsiflorum]|uniref:Uncharacterized protein n=1 Tax=Dendrobium thyrsiflorum TaxID=117978 RepID=A0ABD0VXP6_DENTH